MSRSVRYCKTVLNRIGIYDKETETWKGKFPPIRHLVFSLQEFNLFFYPNKREADVIVHNTRTSNQVTWRSPAKYGRTYLPQYKVFLPWGEQGKEHESGLYYFVGMESGVPFHAIYYKDYPRSLSITLPHAQQILWDACDDPSILPVLWDYLIEYGHNGKAWVERFLGHYPMPQVA